MKADPKAEGRRWLRQAAHDLGDAEYCLAGRRYSLACFLCQQAAEKALKAFLYARGAEQVLGHSVADLASECGSLDADFRVLKPTAAPLGRPYVSGVEGRRALAICLAAEQAAPERREVPLRL